MKINESFKSIMSSISNTNQAGNALNDIANLWIGIRSLGAQEARTTIHLRRERSSLMMSNYIAWFWLERIHCQCLPGHSTGRIGLNGCKANWSCNVFIDSRTAHRVFDPAHFGVTVHPSTSHLQEQVAASDA
ncbi:hypothetical protein Hypma_016197 [Hypsizygus marmoreus]|uniref:Uncharacterized protein n=1 Tax=Hypsizygus marmoreus TaxID=39966 RepID=A0A369J1E9_HYPMA|nr:hypothetical protein Hypma_016197 [Hypsizygus marmoreus]